MKIAELFAELGFKIEGGDELLKFEQSLENIATAARNAALALKGLAAVNLPRVVNARAAQPSNNMPVSHPAFIGPVQPAAYRGPNPPVLPQTPQLPSSVLQGLKSLGLLALKVAGIGTVALALKKLVSGLMDMIKVSMQATFAVDKFTTQTGLSRRELKEWERIAALSDVKAESLQETLKSLQQRSRQIRFTGEGATPFLQLGINAMASPTEIMRQFAQRTKQMDTATAVYFGGLIGISDDMVYMLRKNADKLQNLLPNSELDDQQFRNLTEMNAAWKELTFNIGALRDKIVSDLKPAIVGLIGPIDSWVKLLTASKTLRDFVMGKETLGSLALPALRQMGGTNNKIESKVEVNVNGTDKPRETAQEAAKAVDREVSDAFYQMFPPAFGL